MLHWPRLAQYAASDGRILLLETLAWPTWIKFCKLVRRDDLQTLDERFADQQAYHRALRAEIAALIATRLRDDWIDLLTAADVSAMPVNDPGDLAEDPHYRARGNRYDVAVPEVGTLRLSGTPIRVAGAEFAPSPAPMLGEHADAVLGELAGMGGATIAALRGQGIIG